MSEEFLFEKGISNIYTTYGGLSGPAIKPIGLAAVNKLYKELSIPIIGMGGIVSSTDVAEYILAGSSSVQVGTANFRNPGTGEDLIDMINAYVGESDWKTLVEMIGKVKTYN
jgi:dihydroorotate dehydrogenase (NAD+) catalytic subunit